MKQVLIISGFEANGFAGLLKDVQVCSSLQIHPQAIATTLTAQSETELLAAEPVNYQLIQQQLASLITIPEVIKIGLIPNRHIAETIATWLAHRPSPPCVILDPVLSSSGGGESFSSAHQLTLYQTLLPFISLLAPNLDELKKLTRNERTQTRDQELVDRFYSQNPEFTGCILLTGGHHDTNIHDLNCDGSNNQNGESLDATNARNAHNTVTDTLYEHRTSEQTTISSWQQTKVPIDMRGTGCFLSTAIACGISHGYNTTDSITLANAKLNEHLNKPFKLKNNWPNQLDYFPRVARESKNRSTKPFISFLPMDEPTGLYPIVDSANWIERLAVTGVRTIQLRIKPTGPDFQTQELEDEIKRSVVIANQYNLQLFINDYWQLAIKHNAYGVHLGQEDIDNADLTLIRKAGLRLGISTHGDFELLRALQIGPSYLAVGAIFPTQTKDMTGKIQGLSRLTRYCEMINNIPIVAIGGINTENISEVQAARPSMIAVVSAITKAEYPEQALSELVDRFNICLT